MNTAIRIPLAFHFGLLIGALVGISGGMRNAIAAPNTEGFEYPELMVIPRASDRLEAEAKKESDRKFLTHLPIQASALTTLAAGIIQLEGRDAHKDPDGTSAWAGIAVGSGWLLATGVMAAIGQPYSSAWKEVSALPKGSRREQLARERMAEEALNHQARLGRTLQWIAMPTNFFASVYMAAKAEPGSFSQVVDGVAAAMALAPLIFRYSWIDVAGEQEEYKKRIYGPIGGMVPKPTWFRDRVTGSLSPGMALSFRF